MIFITEAHEIKIKSQTLETKHHTPPIINRMLKLQGNTGQKWAEKMRKLPL